MAMMTKTNDGEQELVIGNKQLLGIFFVVVVLLSVFFTMGYIIGRNTASAGAAQTTAGVATARPDTPAERSATAEPPSQEPAATPPVPQPAPVRVEPAPQTPSAAPQTPAATPRTEPATRYTTNPAPEPEGRPASEIKSIPEGDMYLQVAAIPRADAETERKVLRERGFPTLIGESSKPGLFRVLVGPFKDLASLHISKDELKKAGFESFVVK